MAKNRSASPDTKSKENPLGGIGRKPGSYVGDLDSLLAEVEGSGEHASGNEKKEGVLGQPQRNDAKREEVTKAKAPTKRINLDVPSDLHQRFKGATSMAGRTMTEVLQQLIREYLDETSA